MSSDQDSGITVEKTLHMENAHVTSISYTSMQGRSLIESVRTAEGRGEIRVSDDNGQNWHKQADWPISLGIEGGVEHLASEPHYYLDPEHDCLMEFVTHYDTRVGEVLAVGLPTGITLAAQNLFVGINQGGGTNNGVANTTVVDLAANPLDVRAGPQATDVVTLNFEGSKGELIEAGGSVTLAVNGFFYVSGTMAFGRMTTRATLYDTVTKTSTPDVELSMLTVALYAWLW